MIPIDERAEVAAVNGKLVQVPTGRPGVTMQLYEAEAIRRGLLPAKKAEPVQNKRRLPAKNKARG